MALLVFSSGILKLPLPWPARLCHGPISFSGAGTLQTSEGLPLKATRSYIHKPSSEFPAASGGLQRPSEVQCNLKLHMEG